MMKFCSKCKLLLPFSAFWRDVKKGDGLSSQCKTCNGAIAKRYRQSHKEKISAYYKQWYAKNKERRIAAAVVYKMKNLEKIRAKAIAAATKRKVERAPEIARRKAEADAIRPLLVHLKLKRRYAKHKEYVKAKSSEWGKKQAATLSDTYVAGQIVGKNIGFKSRSEVPKILVEAERERIKLKRLLSERKCYEVA